MNQEKGSSSIWKIRGATLIVLFGLSGGSHVRAQTGPQTPPVTPGSTQAGDQEALKAAWEKKKKAAEEAARVFREAEADAKRKLSEHLTKGVYRDEGDDAIATAAQESEAAMKKMKELHDSMKIAEKESENARIAYEAAEKASNEAPIVKADDTPSPTQFPPANDPEPSGPGNTPEKTAAATCKDDALKAIVATLQNDSDILNKLFNLTSLKVALKVVRDGKASDITIEDALRGEAGKLAKEVESNEGNAEIQANLKALYEKHQKPYDAAILRDEIGKFKTGKYTQGGAPLAGRLFNGHTSAFLLLAANRADEKMRAKTDKLAITEVDVATVWAVEKIRAEAEKVDAGKYKIGSQLGNILNASTRVYHMLTFGDGGVASQERASRKSIEEAIRKSSKEVDTSVETAFHLAESGLTDCLKKAHGTCAQCAIDDFEAFHDKVLNDALASLLQSVSRAKTVQVNKDLSFMVNDKAVKFSFRDVRKPKEPGTGK